MQLTAPQAISGDRLAEQQGQIKPSWQGWGVEGLDGVFQLDEGGIIEIAGAKRVGRTVSANMCPGTKHERSLQLLALHAALRMLIAHRHITCRWIDTEGAFNPARAKSILEHLGVEVSWAMPGWDGSSYQDPEEVMIRLIITPCFDVEPSLFEITAQIREQCADEVSLICVLPRRKADS